MSKMTFVVEFPDGQEPVISAATDILGGKLLSAAFKDATQDIDAGSCSDACTKLRHSLG